MKTEQQSDVLVLHKCNNIQVALTLHGFTLHGSHFTRGLCFCQMNSHYVVHYTFSSLCTIKKILFEY